MLKLLRKFIISKDVSYPPNCFCICNNLKIKNTLVIVDNFDVFFYKYSDVTSISNKSVTYLFESKNTVSIVEL